MRTDILLDAIIPLPRSATPTFYPAEAPECYINAPRTPPVLGLRQLSFNSLSTHSPTTTTTITTMAAIQNQVKQGAVPGAVSNVCPPGTKFHVLEVGWLECDEAFVTRGGNTSLKSTEDQSFVNKRRQMPMYCILVEHPHEGLILWETGCGRDYPTVWGPAASDIFARVNYQPHHELRAAVEATGNRIEDIKKIIIGHLHLDHAGGLDEFLDTTDTEIWVHERELTSAFWSVATGADVGVYLPHYLKLSLYVFAYLNMCISILLIAATEIGRPSMTKPWTSAKASLYTIYPATQTVWSGCRSTCPKPGHSSSSVTIAT